jgi:hypothetical protein
MALEGLEEVLDRDLNAAERAALESRLHRVIDTAGDEDVVRLARHLLDYLHSDAVRVAEDSPGWFERLAGWWRAWETRWWTRSRVRAALIGGLAGLALLGMWESLPAFGSALGKPEWVEAFLSPLVMAGRVAGPRALAWYEARLVLEAVVALILAAGAVVLLLRREPTGVALGLLGVMLSLTVVDLMVFYFEQFSTIVVAGVQFAVLIGLHRYRQRFLLRRRWLDAE